MAVVPQFLDMAVVGVGVGHEEGGLDGTPVGVPPLREQVLRVDVPVLVVDGSAERQCYHLRRLQNKLC